jgi:hypothetical protein
MSTRPRAQIYRVDRFPPRCPPYVPAETVEDLLPYLRAVAKRPYNQGLHAAWDLQPGERVLLAVDTWHDPRCVEAARRVIEEAGCQVRVECADRGPIPLFEGHDEVEYYLSRTRQLMAWMDHWEELERQGTYDKVLQGYGGPILSDRRIKIQRMPFVVPEIAASRAHTLPYEILDALDRWTWAWVAKARRVRITDAEGTDLRYTVWDDYFDSARQDFNEDYIRHWFPQNVAFSKTYLPGHIWGRPWFFVPQEDGEGVIAGTMNHIGPFPYIRMYVEKSRIVAIEGGGLFGEKLRRLKADTDHLQYPGFNGPGLLHWWEASIGTNPKIHRPRKDYLKGLNCGLYERMRSGIVHIGYGTIISSAMEREACRQGLPVGHFHVHLNFATVALEMPDGSTVKVVEDGHLAALDAPEVRAIAAKYGDPDDLLREDWIPAIPGINMDGDYWRDYAEDPLDWTRTELHICQKWHHFYLKMVQPRGASSAPACHG